MLAVHVYGCASQTRLEPLATDREQVLNPNQKRVRIPTPNSVWLLWPLVEPTMY